jgi:hypothetical protein
MTTTQPLTAAAIAAMRHEVQVSLDASSGLDDAGRIDLIRALEELVCTATAAQAAHAADLAESVGTDHDDLGIPPARRGQGVASQVALARRESPHRGQRHLGLARVVRSELPHTWAAWRAGRVTEWRATLIARETACLSLEHRLALDELLAADHDAFERMSDREVVGRAQSEAARLDAEAVTARRRKAESERRVSIRPAPDSMVWLTTLLPVKEGVATYATLTREADRARAQGDPRTRGQVMADSLVQCVLEGTGGETAGVASRSHGSVPVALGVVMTDHALFGGADDAAHLEGFGPIPAELAREIVCGALSADQRVSIRRLYASPDTGELVAMEARTRTFRGNLARFVRLRDQVCRTPWCDAPIRHTDHVVPHGAGGPTGAANGQGLCEACNYARTAPRWRASPGPGGTAITTTPTGHSLTTRPPPIATVTRRDLPVLTIDYVLAS